MTGNLVLLGVAIGQAQFTSSIRSVIAFAGFAVGLLIGGRMTAKTEPDAVWPPSVSRAMIGELSFLLAFLVGWEIAGDRPATLALDILAALSAGAMGMQTALARRLGVGGVTTTFITGTLTSLIAGFAAVGPGRSRSMMWAATLACLVIGAAAGAALFIAWRPGGPLVAVLLVAIVLALGAARRQTEARA